MLKRWASWSPGIRWLAGIVAGVLALAIVWALLVPVSDWLAHHDVGPAQGSRLQTARDAARGRLLTLGAGLFAAGALLYTARNFALSRHTFELAEQGQVTDRYTKAIEQLGSDKLDVRIGGIYALERVARDSARDHPTVIEVLNAFVREHSREQWPLPQRDTDPAPPRQTRPDVHAALTVIRRRDASRDIRPIDLTGADLTRANFTSAILTDARLTGADLTGAELTYADLTRADLSGADLSGVDLTYVKLAYVDLSGAHLSGVDLSGVDLSGAHLSGAHLSGAILTGAHLATADLSGAHLTGARLTGADLTIAHLTDAILNSADLTRANLDGADLTGADLRGANLADAILTRVSLGGADLSGAHLTRADLSGARWPENVPVPEGWRMDADSSGRLAAEGTDSGSAEAD